MAVGGIEALAPWIAKDAEVLRCFEDSLQFEPGISFGLRAGIAIESTPLGCLEDPMDTFANTIIPDHDEPRWLH